MLPIVQVSVLREADARAVAGGASLDVLVGRAGGAVARAAAALLERARGRVCGCRVVAVVGHGHNGADALAALAVLAGRGVQVSAVCVDMARFGALANTLADEVVAHGGRVLASDSPAVRGVLGQAQLVLDGLLGTGARGPVRDEVAAAIERIAEARAQGALVLAVDIASGLEPETGCVRKTAVTADVTLTFQALKLGQLLGEGPQRSGALTVADIGVALPTARWTMSEKRDIVPLVKVPRGEQHKRRRGVVVLVAGSVGMAGAASLAAHGAQRAGAGLLVLAVPKEIAARVGAAVPEALTVALPSVDGKITPDAPAALEAWWPQATCCALGPGLGRGPLVTQAVAALLDRADVPAVVDADGLVALAELAGAEGGRGGIMSRRRAGTLLTPHAGEFARLLSSQEVDREATVVAHLLALAQTWGCTTLLKGNLTFIADPLGRLAVNPTGTPVLATGGTGDVLTGVCASLIAQGMEPFDAARLGAWVHGQAGRRAARATSPVSVTAGDVVDALPQAFAELLSSQQFPSQQFPQEEVPGEEVSWPAPVRRASSLIVLPSVGRREVVGVPKDRRLRPLPNFFVTPVARRWQPR